MTSGVEKYEFEGKLFALVVRKSYKSDGASFITEKDSLLQLGILTHKKGVELRPHTHRVLTRTVDKTNEVLYLIEGKLHVDFYSEDGRILGKTVLEKGDTILLLGGGHGFKMLDDSRIMEVKQGPYNGIEGDKEDLIVKK
jgi:hypothetical protein